MNTDIIEHIDPNLLHPHPDNSMKHGDGQITALVASFEQFGFNGVIVIDEDNVVLAGHGRRLAAIRAGLATVNCLRRTGLTDLQKRAYIIADNKIGREGEWDEEVLAKQIEQLSGDGFDLDSLGIGAEALASILEPEKTKKPRAKREPGEPRPPSNLKLDAEKLLHLVEDLAADMADEALPTKAVTIGRIEGVTYQLVACDKVEAKSRKLVAPTAEQKCLSK